MICGSQRRIPIGGTGAQKVNFHDDLPFFCDGIFYSIAYLSIKSNRKTEKNHKTERTAVLRNNRIYKKKIPLEQTLEKTKEFKATPWGLFMSRRKNKKYSLGKGHYT